MTADNQPTGYVASASSTNSTRDPYRAFDNVLYSSWHEPVYQSNPYPNTDGAYTGGSGTVYDTNGYQGEYLQIQLPEKIKLYNYSISNRPAAGLEGRQPKDAKIFASDDGNTWIDIHTHSDGGGTYDIAGETRSFQLDNITETHYKYYRLVVNSIIQGGTSDTANISQWQLYGTPEYDPEAHGVDVVVKSVPNVPNTDWLEVYYDAKDLTGVPSTVLDLSGNSRNGTLNGGVGFDTEYKAFTFDGGGGTYIDITDVGNASGNWTHSVSFWVKPQYDGSGNDVVFRLGPGADNKAVGFLYNATQIGYYFYGNDFSASYALTNKWYHITLTYDGNERNIYINGGQDRFSSTTGGGNLNLDGNDGMRIGTNQASSAPMTGSIANFRLFNRALTSDEVWQLYAYQKEYFGHGDLGMTLKAGRLGIGTSEPRAALDVWGDVNVEGRVLSGHASGGNESVVDGYKIHTFTSSGNFNVVTPGVVEYLIIGGGGGGGGTHGGGGGGGGFIQGHTLVKSGSHSIVVGGGGAGSTVQGANGVNSTAFGLTAVGGGGGGRGYDANVSSFGNIGGSSGGSGPFVLTGSDSRDFGKVPEKTYTNRYQGNGGGGGNNTGGAGHGGGGGGAGGGGGNATTTSDYYAGNGISGAGGSGLVSYITGSLVIYAGGGSGGRWSGSQSINVQGGVGGTNGGGGIGGATGLSGMAATAGGINTGGGGGGGSDSGGRGGNGGSGIIVLRYPV